MEMTEIHCNDDKKKIILNEESEDFQIIKKHWFDIARTGVRTPEQLKEFADSLLNDYIHDYGTVVHAISAIATAAAWMGSHIEGITGFQAGCVMWEFIREWYFRDNKTGLKIVDYDDMLYPQCSHKYEKTISKDIWEKLQETAKEKLEEIETSELEYVHPAVKSHWESIADGVIPFGYRLKEE